MKVSNYCRFGGCKNNSSNKELHFYRFPKNESRCQAWVKACHNHKLVGIPASKLHNKAFLCSDHFEDWCFMNITKKHRLVHNAIPGCKKLQILLLAHEKCAIMGCKNRSSDKKQGVRFHRFPVNEEVRNAWTKAVGRENWVPEKDSRVCSEHFDDCQFMSPGKTSLRENAVPTIFDGCFQKLVKSPSYHTNSPQLCAYKISPETAKFLNEAVEPFNTSFVSENNQQNRNQPCDNKPVNIPSLRTFLEQTSSTIKSEPTDHPIPDHLIQASANFEKGPSLSRSDMPVKLENNSNEHSTSCINTVDNFASNSSSDSSMSCNGFNFKFLSYNVDKIEKPNALWSFACTSDFVIYAKWDSNYMPEKRVVIEPNQNVKVFFKGSQIDLPEVRLKVNSVDDVSDLLNEVDEIAICAGIPQIPNRVPEKCSLYLPKVSGIEGSDFCEECLKSGIKQEPIDEGNQD